MGSSSGNGLWWVVGLRTLAILWCFSAALVRDIAKAAEDWGNPSSPKLEAVLRISPAVHLKRTLPATAVVSRSTARRGPELTWLH